jgi:hypothetical protein
MLAYPIIRTLCGAEDRVGVATAESAENVHVYILHKAHPHFHLPEFRLPES